MLQICRVCLTYSHNGMQSMNEGNLKKSYVLMTDMELEEKEPLSVCWECGHHLISYLRFQEKVNTSLNLLMDIWGRSENVTVKEISKIDREQYKLQSNLTFKTLYEFSIDSSNDTNIKSEDDDLTNELLVETGTEDRISVKSEEDRCSSEDLLEIEDSIELCGKEEIAVNEEIAVENNEKGEREETVVRRQVKNIEMNERDSKSPKQTRLEELFEEVVVSYEDQIKEIRLRKQSDSYLRARYRCEVCCLGFPNKHKYDAHNTRHDVNRGAFECFICKRRTSTKVRLQRHMASSHRSRLLCKLCPFTTKDKSCAIRHEKFHSGVTYKCSHCPSEFDKHTTYMGHLRKKHVSDIVCAYCGYTFISQKGLYQHKNLIHKLLLKDELQGPRCTVCEVTFASEEAHSRHLFLSSKHTTDVEREVLKSMAEPKTRQERRDFRNCKLTRVKSKEYKGGEITCEENKPNFITHMWVHTGEKCYKCQLCQKGFTSKMTLSFHNMAAHDGVRGGFPCELCDRSFSSSTNLKRHLLNHKGLKPFPCTLCDKRFRTKPDQRLHYQHVHLNVPWPKRIRTKRTPT